MTVFAKPETSMRSYDDRPFEDWQTPIDAQKNNQHLKEVMRVIEVSDNSFTFSNA